MCAGLALKPDAMPTSMFCLTELHVEILEQVLLRMPGHDIKIKTLSHAPPPPPDNLLVAAEEKLHGG